MRRSFTLLALGLAFAWSPLHAAEPSYIGKWKFSGAVVAPWADPKLRKPDETERARLPGKILAFNAKAIAGPQPFVCKGRITR